MKIPVIKNPVAKSSNGARRKKPMAKKRRASAAQLAARKLFAKRFGGKKRKAAPSRPKAKRRKRKALSAGRHRPVVIRKAGKLYRPKRSSLAPRAKFANPFLGQLAMIGGNPMSKRKSRKSRKSRRSSRRSVSIFRNPLGNSLSSVMSAPKQMISKDFLTEAASVAVGFVLPNIVMTNLPANLRDARWKGYASKVAVVAVLAGATGMVSKRVSKAILLGGGVSLLLDLYTDFVAPMVHGAAAPAPGVKAFYGNDEDPGADAGMGAFWGVDSDPGAGLGDGRAIGEAFA